jgi:hypothetical protein
MSSPKEDGFPAASWFRAQGGLCFLGESPLPAATEVCVVVDGFAADADGMGVDADADGLQGGRAVADFRTLPVTRIPNESLWIRPGLLHVGADSGVTIRDMIRKRAR